jgi:anti-anti-sigma factor
MAWRCSCSSATAPLRARVDDVAAPALVVDLSQVTFLDSSALRELLYARHLLAERRGRLILAGVPHNMRKLLDLTGTSAMFDTAPTRDEALRRIAADRR